MLNQSIVNTESGMVGGSNERGVTRFFDIPYAQEDRARGRFGKSVEPDSWSGVREATRPGPVFPQLSARLAGVMGDLPEFNQQSESAFRLNVWTPSTDGCLPVLFWIHGGGWLSGGGGLRWYHGDGLVGSGRVVLVTVNYRLGVLGNLCMPGVAPGSMALDDLTTALRWVQTNISNFGGDPRRVTVGGQSAGAWYAQAMLSYRKAQGMFAQAALISSPAAIQPPSRAEALALGRRYCELLEQPLDGSTLHDLPLDQILTGQICLLRDQIGEDWERGVFAGIPMPFLPVREDVSFDTSAVQARHIPVLLGNTGEEMAAFYFDNAFANDAGSSAVALHFEQVFGIDGKVRYQEYGQRRENATPYLQLVDLMSETIFRNPARNLAGSLSRQGSPVYVYQFNYGSRKAGLHACHCFELPFLFGNFDNWSNAPMLAGIDRVEARTISEAFQGSLRNFVESGNPNGAGIPAWNVFDGSTGSEMVFGCLSMVNT
jgi:para-nitrobenzyl esterase